MKTKLEMAHEWAMKHGNAETVGSRQNMVKYAWNYADAMQAEADRRENKTRPEVLMAVQQTFINGIEQPRYATSMGDQKRTPKVSRFERSDAVKEVLSRAENMGLIKPKAVDEWQPDWSQAPDGYDWWAMDGFSGVANWYKSEPFLDDDDTDEWNVVLSIATYREAPSFGHTGDWRESLRKRPK